MPNNLLLLSYPTFILCGVFRHFRVIKYLTPIHSFDFKRHYLLSHTIGVVVGKGHLSIFQTSFRVVERAGLKTV